MPFCHLDFHCEAQNPGSHRWNPARVEESDQTRLVFSTFLFVSDEPRDHEEKQSDREWIQHHLITVLFVQESVRQCEGRVQSSCVPKYLPNDVLLLFYIVAQSPRQDPLCAEAFLLPWTSSACPLILETLPTGPMPFLLREHDC